MARRVKVVEVGKPGVTAVEAAEVRALARRLADETEAAHADPRQIAGVLVRLFVAEGDLADVSTRRERQSTMMRQAARQGWNERRANKTREDSALRLAVDTYRQRHPGCSDREIAADLWKRPPENLAWLRSTYEESKKPIDAIAQRIRRLPRKR